MSGRGVINCYAGLPARFRAQSRPYRNFERVRILLPARVAIIGSSGSGKSNILLNLVLQLNAFTKIYMFVKSPDEPLYAYLIEEIRKIEAKLGVEILVVSTDLDELPEVDSFDGKEATLMIFDDIISESAAKLKTVSDFWIRGRKRSLSLIFLTQSFFAVPKIIRGNTDVFIFKRLGKRDLNLVLSDFSLTKTGPELMEMYRSCDTTNISNFFMIDLSPSQDPRYIYRHNFDPIGGGEDDPVGDQIKNRMSSVKQLDQRDS